MKQIEKVYQSLKNKYTQEDKEGYSAGELAKELDLHRSNVSGYLNKLVKKGRVKKITGRPVLFKPLIKRKTKGNDNKNTNLNQLTVFDQVIGKQGSLKTPIEQAKAAILYPPNGLHTLLLGDTGVGKTMFAELMHQFAIESGTLDFAAPFITFNCADYANNPQLLMGQLFGIKKGAYTGANQDKEGLLEKANGGILFLDEVHRLPSEGQEMLFTFIDKGIFRKLGDTENELTSDVLIVAATTEDPESSLLETFNRRIPMVINLPPLEKRSLEERLALIKEFFQQESKRIGEVIYAKLDVIKALLLYHCKNNIGQLKSDIQLGCARAFLSYMNQGKNKLLVDKNHFSESVKKGLLNLKNNRQKISQVVDNSKPQLRFSPEKKERFIKQEDQYDLPGNFYNSIERKLFDLKSKGVNEQEANQIVNSDIESYFEEYIGDFDSQINREELLKIVGKNILEVTEQIREYVNNNLDTELPSQLILGLALHIQSAVQRIKEGEKIVNSQLNEIRMKHPEEFSAALKITEIIESQLGIQLPLDEVGYLTMFLCPAEYQFSQEEEDKVGVIVAMHGAKAASSMVKVANKLLQVNHARAMDMPLTMDPKQAYSNVKNLVQEVDQGRGVLLLVDMGSLTTFGELIHQETGIEIKTIEMVSTPMVLEATRKAIISLSLEEIFDFTINVNPYLGKKLLNDTSKQQEYRQTNLVITSCFTGEGTAVKLKSTIYKNLDLEANNAEVMALNISDNEKFKQKIKKLSQEYNIVAIIGSINPKLAEGIPFIRAEEIFTNQGLRRLSKIIEAEDIYLQVAESLDEHLLYVDAQEVIQDIRRVIDDIVEELNLKVKEDSLVGWILHISFMLDQILAGDRNREYQNKETIKEDYKKEYQIIKDKLKLLESNYQLEISDGEVCSLVEIMLELSI
ncbi:transcriptional antiterminator [Halobacteroides halobius DSM 5150]|uniref:Transcriptional antiterminator n=1 Tax=Halobacteroides halobius (strain ATCC 35273 / DSM 5150 / MD-1) TaxID=748449 RepID=L0KBN2_HALHC|nr:sigma-54-dependent transcriptional regulator [Halobacteroides halobius]AGB42411.1 transcriptional antiterminator [Halobacteroides halobius DSM 5150]